MDLQEAALTGYVVGARHPWERARIEVARTLLAEGAVIPPGGSTVLDVGCGDTFVAESLARAFPGARFLAVDPAFDASMVASYSAHLRESGLPVAVFASVEQALAGHAGAVDGVLLLDVIEHVEDDVDLLRGLAGLPGVGPRTTFLITVPAFPSLFGAHDVFLRHFRRYRRASLEACVRRAGLVPVRTGYFFASLLPARMLALLVERLRGAARPRGIGDWRGSPISDAILRGVLLADFRVTHALSRLGIVLPGLSCYALCRPSA